MAENLTSKTLTFLFDTFINSLLEIIKITIPALVVFWTVNSLLRNYLGSQLQQKHLELQLKQRETTLPLKLQAYERLALLCERMDIPALLTRTRKEGMSAKVLRLAMLLSIQEEFEYNLTQQVYVSGQLWQILKAARDNAVHLISTAGEELPAQAAGSQYAQQLLQLFENSGGTGSDMALQAIKKEVDLLLG